MVAKRKYTESAPSGRAASQPAPELADSEAGSDYRSSPARLLQEDLAARISDGFAIDAEADVERWPRRQRLAFLIASSCALWAVTIGFSIIGSAVLR